MKTLRSKREREMAIKIITVIIMIFLFHTHATCSFVAFCQSHLPLILYLQTCHFSCYHNSGARDMHSLSIYHMCFPAKLLTQNFLIGQTQTTAPALNTRNPDSAEKNLNSGHKCKTTACTAQHRRTDGYFALVSRTSGGSPAAANQPRRRSRR